MTQYSGLSPYYALVTVQVDEAEVDFVTRHFTAVVQGQQQLVLQQAAVDAGDTTLQALVEFELDPHTEKYGHGVTDEPGHPQAEQDQPHHLAEQDPQQDHECCEYPNNQNSLVENIEHCESHISG